MRCFRARSKAICCAPASREAVTRRGRATGSSPRRRSAASGRRRTSRRSSCSSPKTSARRSSPARSSSPTAACSRDWRRSDRVMLKRILKGAIAGASEMFVRANDHAAAGRHAIDRLVDAAVNRTATVRHNGIELVLAVPNAVNRSRVAVFSAKEPETLQWIDAIPRGSVLWDIGANVGHYSCYAAKARGCRVFAFEPSVFNLEFLARNVHLNGLGELVTIVPLALTDVAGASALHMTTTQWGGALSTFGRDYGFDGRPMKTAFEF